MTFLLTYGNINKKFVQDFYKIINDKYIENYDNYVINSEILRKWLKIKTKQVFENTIRFSYIENKDYIIKKKKNNKGSGGHNYQFFLLTPRAAKEICLSTKSEFGKMVREYFIEIEFILYKYKNYIIKGLNEKIRKLENNQKPKINSNKKIIYVFRAFNTNEELYKIGKTKNLKKRFKTYNSSTANDIEILFYYETESIDQVELCVKNLMKKAQYRSYKEIYQINIDILKKVIRFCDIKILSINDELKKQKGGYLFDYINKNDLLFLLIPQN